MDPAIDRVGRQIVDAAYRVHSALGPGLLESVNETCLAHVLTKRGFEVRRQVERPVLFDGLRLETAFRIDLVVDDLIIVELKAVEHVLPVHVAQVLTYLKLSGYRLGYLINFNVPIIKSGIRRLIR